MKTYGHTKCGQLIRKALGIAHDIRRGDQGYDDAEKLVQILDELEIEIGKLQKASK